MPLMFHNGKPLFTADGKLAMSADCCCNDCLGSARVVEVAMSYSVGTRGGIGSVDASDKYTCATIQTAGRDTTFMISFTPLNGATQRLSSIGEIRLDNGDCEDYGTIPYLRVDASSSGSTATITFTACVTRKGILNIFLVPRANGDWINTDGQCDPNYPFYILYAPSVAWSVTGGPSGVTPMSWNVQTEDYDSSATYVETIR